MGITRIQKTEWLECFIKARQKAIRCSNVQGRWCGSGIYPFNSFKVLNKLPSSQAKSITTSLSRISIDDITTNIFDLALQENGSVDCASVQSVNIALKTLLHNNQPLNTPIRKYITRLIEKAEYLLTENIILQYEVKSTKDILSKRKTRESRKRMILKGAQVISTIEYFEQIKACEMRTKKNAPTGRPRGRPHKDASASLNVIVEEDGNESE